MSAIDVKKVKILAVHHRHTHISKKPWRNKVPLRRSGRPKRGWEAGSSSILPQQFAQSPLRSIQTSFPIVVSHATTTWREGLAYDESLIVLF